MYDVGNQNIHLSITVLILLGIFMNNLLVHNAKKANRNFNRYKH